MIGVLGSGPKPDRLVDALQRAGASVRALEPDESAPAACLDGLDGLVICDGPDVDATASKVQQQVAAAAIKQRLPTRAIGSGMQLLNLAAGGSMLGDIATHFDPTVPRRYQIPHEAPHDVAVLRNSRLYRALGDREALTVASVHRQGIAQVAPGFIPVAAAADGIVEAIELQRENSIQGLQSLPVEDALLTRWAEAFMQDTRPKVVTPVVTGRSPTPPVKVEPLAPPTSTEPRAPTKLSNDIKSQSIRHAARRGKAAMEDARDFTHYEKSIQAGQEHLLKLIERTRDSSALQTIHAASVATGANRLNSDMLGLVFETLRDDDKAADDPQAFLRFVAGKLLNDYSNSDQKRTLVTGLVSTVHTPLFDVVRNIANSGVNDRTACQVLERGLKDPNASLASFGDKIKNDIYDAAQRNRVHRILLGELCNSTDANTEAVAKSAMELRQLDIGKDDKARLGDAAFERMGRGLLVEPTPQQAAAGFIGAAIGGMLTNDNKVLVGAAATRALHNSTEGCTSDFTVAVSSLAGVLSKRNGFYTDMSTVTLYKSAFKVLRAGVTADLRDALTRLSKECLSDLFNDDERKFIGKRIADRISEIA